MVPVFLVNYENLLYSPGANFWEPFRFDFDVWSFCVIIWISKSHKSEHSHSKKMVPVFLVNYKNLLYSPGANFWEPFRFDFDVWSFCVIIWISKSHKSEHSHSKKMVPVFLVNYKNLLYSPGANFWEPFRFDFDVWSFCVIIWISKSHKSEHSRSKKMVPVFLVNYKNLLYSPGANFWEPFRFDFDVWSFCVIIWISKSHKSEHSHSKKMVPVFLVNYKNLLYSPGANFWEPFRFGFLHPLMRKLFLYLSHLQSENSCCTCQVLVDSKIYASESDSDRVQQDSDHVIPCGSN